MNARPLLTEIRPASVEEWEAMLRSDPSATFFHSPAWCRVWESYAGYQSRAVFFRWENGQEAILPCALQRKWLGIKKIYWNTPAWNYGGVISSGELAQNVLRGLENYMERHWPHFVMRENPFSPNRFGAGRKMEDFTQVIDLQQGTEEILKKWSASHRNELAQAQRNGLTVRLASSDADWAEYYAAYMDSAGRWGKKTDSLYRAKLFDSIWAECGEHCRLWLAFREDALLYGCLCFYQGNHVGYWHGAGFSEHLRLHPVVLLQFHIIEHAAQAGYRWYDLNHSGGLAGVEQFKKALGAERRSCDLWIK